MHLSTWSGIVFQCSSASRKFLNRGQAAFRRSIPRVSVLFSEPKIPQCNAARWLRSGSASFSALQRAENSSIRFVWRRSGIGQYSFSALQRAENSSIQTSPDCRRCFSHVSVLFSEPKIPQFSASGRARYSAPEFQCSSASRKFLNASH